MTAPLNLTPEPDGVEEITVLGKRRQPIQERSRAAASLSLGPFMLEGSTGQVGGFEGARVSASTPLGGVRGLDAVMSVSGGYEQRSQNATVSGGAVTAGIRLRF